MVLSRRTWILVMKAVDENPSIGRFCGVYSVKKPRQAEFDAAYV